jgi:hypothetical protein
LEHKELALVRVVNASPRDPALVVFAGDSAAFSGVDYNDKPLAENHENLMVVAGTPAKVDIIKNEDDVAKDVSSK